MIKMSREGKLGEFIILEFKRMSDVTENYLTWVKDKGTGRYESSKSVLERSIGLQGWEVKQVSFIAGARSLNDQDLRKILFNGKSEIRRRRSLHKKDVFLSFSCFFLFFVFFVFFFEEPC